MTKAELGTLFLEPSWLSSEVGNIRTFNILESCGKRMYTKARHRTPGRRSFAIGASYLDYNLLLKSSLLHGALGMEFKGLFEIHSLDYQRDSQSRLWGNLPRKEGLSCSLGWVFIRLSFKILIDSRSARPFFIMPIQTAGLSTIIVPCLHFQVSLNNVFSGLERRNAENDAVHSHWDSTRADK